MASGFHMHMHTHNTSTHTCIHPPTHKRQTDRQKFCKFSPLSSMTKGTRLFYNQCWILFRLHCNIWLHSVSSGKRGWRPAGQSSGPDLRSTIPRPCVRGKKKRRPFRLSTNIDLSGAPATPRLEFTLETAPDLLKAGQHGREIELFCRKQLVSSQHLQDM